MPRPNTDPDGVVTARPDRIRARARVIFDAGARRARSDPGFDAARSWAHAWERARRTVALEDERAAASAEATARARAAADARPPSSEWLAAWAALRDFECRDSITGDQWDEHARLMEALRAARR